MKVLWVVVGVAVLAVSIASLRMSNETQDLLAKHSDARAELLRRLDDHRERTEELRLAIEQAQNAMVRSQELEAELSALRSEVASLRSQQDLATEVPIGATEEWKGYPISHPYLTSNQLPPEVIEERGLLDTDMFLELGDGRLGWLRLRDDRGALRIADPAVGQALLDLHARRLYLLSPNNPRARLREFPSHQEAAKFLKSETHGEREFQALGSLPDGTPYVLYLEGEDLAEIERISSGIHDLRSQEGASLCSLQVLSLDPEGRTPQR